MLTRFDRHTTLLHGLVLRGISIAFIVWFMRAWLDPFLSLSDGLEPLDMRLYYGPDAANALLNALGQTGKSYYLKLVVGDFVFMGFALAGDLILLRLLLERLGWGSWPRFVLIGGVGADVVENLVVVAVLTGAPVQLFWLGGIATLVKQCAAMVVLAVYAGGLLGWAWRSLRHQPST